MRLSGKLNALAAEIWYCDYRTNIHHASKKMPLRFDHLAVDCYNRARHFDRSLLMFVEETAA